MPSAALTAYLIGSIPFALIVGKLFWGVDIREHGSGNTGATNVLRVFGPAPGFTVLALDMAKGSAAVYLAALFVPLAFGPEGQDWFRVIGALGAIAGHSFSPFIGFRGGKGVATAAGAIIVLAPRVIPFMVLAFLAVTALSRMVSLGSMAIACLFPVTTALLYPGRYTLLAFAVATAILVVWRHRANIGRIMRKEETKITFRRRLLDETGWRKNRERGK
ncbi:MAG: glycerol-3-phosphate 1-O-acyltransferase PlsY [Coriobacteriia bacterium]|nr:glycerol-3-phosphate 1-O-acyltransferase PlsY [Coriobacteriia bacterium]MBN2823095.1 glycerol-3-phosphate 1-O-acyltransferase PlsY [Coriobacteriia bacterium]